MSLNLKKKFIYFLNPKHPAISSITRFDMDNLSDDQTNTNAAIIW